MSFSVFWDVFCPLEVQAFVLVILFCDYKYLQMCLLYVSMVLLGAFVNIRKGGMCIYEKLKLARFFVCATCWFVRCASAVWTWPFVG